MYQGGVTLGSPGALVADTDGAISLNGSDALLVVQPVHGFPATQISVEFWLKTTDTTKQGTLVSYASSNTLDNAFRVMDQRDFTVTVNNTVSTATGVSANDGRWHQVVATWRSSDGQTQLYKDGVLVWSGKVAAGASITDGGDLVLGQDQDLLAGGYDPTQAFLGGLDEVAIYATVLSADRIQAHYAAGSSVSFASPTPTALASSTPTSTPTSGGDPVVAAAGDIACDPADPAYAGGTGTSTACHMLATSTLLSSTHPTAVLALGDEQYDSATLTAFQQSYGPTWGLAKAITHPVPGNHEYDTSAAAGYYSYFGAAAGNPATGYYSFDLRAWHIVALNGECASVGGCGAGSPQELWLKADLAAHPAACTLAVWHEPRFSSDYGGNDSTYAVFWQDLYAAGADLVLNGHNHQYERFAPQDPNANSDPAHGLVELVVGTGGKSHFIFGISQPNSLVRNNDTYGILLLTLHASSYDWQFVPEAGMTFTDAGTAPCH
jgi:hypothetical protein